MLNFLGKKISLPFCAIIVAMFFWASSFIALKMAFRAFDPMAVILGRMIVGSIFFLVFFKKLRGNHYKKGDYRYLIGMAIFEPCLYFVFEAQALTMTSASQAGMVTAILPLIVSLGSFFILGERLKKNHIPGLVIAAVGVCWLSVTGEKTVEAPHPTVGNFLEACAMLSSAGYIIIARHLTSRYNPFFLTALQTFIGSFFFIPFVLCRPNVIFHTDIFLPSMAVLYLGIFVTVGAYALYNYGMTHIEAHRASSFINLIPIFALLLGFIVLGESFTLHQYIASAIIFTGILISK